VRETDRERNVSLPLISHHTQVGVESRGEFERWLAAFEQVLIWQCMSGKKIHWEEAHAY
jgi:hypothetical protein